MSVNKKAENSLHSGCHIDNGPSGSGEGPKRLFFCKHLSDINVRGSRCNFVCKKELEDCKMPSSPLTRRSPATELKVESAHKRGHSFESKYSPKPKDDDLLLFNEVQNRERENFLLHSFDDFDESISKLKYFSDFSLGITIPARTKRSDLLDADGEKNDYDWLMTPPDTPLFPSLDDDVSQSANASRGRTISQPISIPNTLSARPNRTSESPHRLSSSPKSNYGVSRPRSRPSSVPRSSPPPILRPATPSRGPSTPPTKPSSSTQLFLTPQRMSTGSSVQTFTNKRGMSPAKVNRGNSASPKLRGWQSNLPGFSTDVPPNLRTSLTDQSATRVRGSSPVSGNRRGPVPKYGRQSLSPSSRSTISLRNSEGDEFSSISKPSTTSSHEDDAQSHASAGVFLNAATRKCRDYAHNRAMGFSKKPSGSFSASSAPKRSFDFARRQTDHHRTPQYMFRPLLSSVPASTFYSAKTNSVHGPMLSRNSSLTTSSNASSDQGASFVLDLEDTDHDQSDLTCKWDGTKIHGFQEEIFVLDKLDEVSEDICHETGKCQSNIGIFDEGMSGKVNSKLDTSMANVGVVVNTVAYEDSSFADEVSDNNAGKKMSTCLKCGKYFDLMDTNVCQECLPSYCLVSSKESETDATSQDINSVEKSSICLKCGKSFTVMDMIKDVCQECNAIHGSIAYKASGTRQVAARDDPNDTPRHEIQRKMGMYVPPNSRHHSTLEQQEQISEGPVTDFSMDSRVHLMTHKNKKNLSEQEIFIPNELNDCCKCESPQSVPTPCSNDGVEGTGIAILLTNSSSSRKHHIVQGNSSLTNILYTEPSYGVDIHIIKRSLGKDSSSSSSVELGPSEQTDMLILHQLGNRKDEMDNVRCESHITSDSDLDKFSAIDRSPYNEIETDQVFSRVNLGLENNVENLILNAQKPENSSGGSDLSGLKHSSTEQAAISTDESCYASSYLASSGILLQLGEENTLQMHDSSISGDPGRTCISYQNMDDVCLHNSEGGNEKMEKRTTNQDTPLIEDNYMVTDKVCETQDEIFDVATSSLPIVTLDQQNEIVSCQDAQIDFTPVEMTLCLDLEDCTSIPLDKDVLPSELESKFSQDSSFEEPVTIEFPEKQVQRCFTLEEATDTILFCSSIVHDIGYKAATIAVDKDFAVRDSLHRPITFLGSTISNHKDFQKASSGRTRSPKRIKRKKQETADKMTSIELTKNVANSEITSCDNKVTNTIDSAKPPKLESKCNCTVM
ncbi:hypothetical protein ZIOFF_066438 [Zingiber officinale]|uniref:Uncharacterized protein n=2 Tax=Zingiber officinale TaxID=94328 RepID=A0A8J5F3E1_ZINOF|nr:hypothetical protein ZIOFF_066438 [Zingiber officinale]